MLRLAHCGFAYSPLLYVLAYLPSSFIYIEAEYLVLAVQGFLSAAYITSDVLSSVY